MIITTISFALIMLCMCFGLFVVIFSNQIMNGIYKAMEFLSSIQIGYVVGGILSCATSVGIGYGIYYPIV